MVNADYGSITYFIPLFRKEEISTWFEELGYSFKDYEVHVRHSSDAHLIRFKDDDAMHIQFKLIFPELTTRSIKVTR